MADNTGDGRTRSAARLNNIAFGLLATAIIVVVVIALVVWLR